jgi:hypothetical protein
MAEDKSKNGHLELPKCGLEVWRKGIYSCRDHIATSFVPTVRVIGQEIFRGDLEILGE